MLIDMIPPEYWKQLRKELNSLGDDCNPYELERLKNREERRKRLNAEYDAVIRKKRNETKRKRTQKIG